jgi:hypothetical protein
VANALLALHERRDRQNAGDWKLYLRAICRRHARMGSQDSRDGSALDVLVATLRHPVSQLYAVRKWPQGEGLRPGCRKPSLVEAGGQPIRGFRCGLDYAFILQAFIGLQDAERVMPQLHRDILVPAQRQRASSAGL